MRNYIAPFDGDQGSRIGDRRRHDHVRRLTWLVGGLVRLQLEAPVVVDSPWNESRSGYPHVDRRMGHVAGRIRCFDDQPVCAAFTWGEREAAATIRAGARVKSVDRGVFRPQGPVELPLRVPPADAHPTPPHDLSAAAPAPSALS